MYNKAQKESLWHKTLFEYLLYTFVICIYMYQFFFFFFLSFPFVFGYFQTFTQTQTLFKRFESEKFINNKLMFTTLFKFNYFCLRLKKNHNFERRIFFFFYIFFFLFFKVTQHTSLNGSKKKKRTSQKKRVTEQLRVFEFKKK